MLHRHSFENLAIRASAATIAIFVISAAVHGGGILYVDDDAPLGGDGNSWDTAYRFLQDAMTDAGGDDIAEIRVGQGIYPPDCDEANPDGTGDRQATFQLLNGVALMGGYAGIGAKDPDARDIELYETILSGDLLDNDGPDFVNYEENSYHIVRSNKITGATLDGFTVTAGRAEEPDDDGGGMHNTDSSFSVIECRFLANLCDDDGGGMFNFNSDVLMSDCIFSGNVSLGVSGTGGGAVASFSSQVVMLNCDLHDNEGFLGGAVADVSQSATSLLINCSLTNNRATGVGGAIFNQDNVRVLINCIIDGNLSQGVRNGFPNLGSGGGMFNQLTSTSVWVNVRATGNNAGGDGAAVYNNADSTASFVNCTFADNSASLEGGGIYNSDDNGTIHVDNSILWGNSDAGGIDESAQVQLSRGAGSLNFSCVQGLTGDLGGVGNIGEDPMFVDPETGDYRLSSGSTCIDAAANFYLPKDIDTDLGGNPRFIDDPTTKDTGVVDCPIVDMGSYEFQEGTTDCGTVSPDEFSAFRGFYVSGDLDSLLDSDDNDLCYEPGIVLNQDEAPVTLDFTGTLPNDSPASLDVTIESSASTVGLELTFSFWNYNTESWDIVGTDTQSLNEDTVRTFASDPTDHVEPGTGEVRTRYEVRVVSFIFLFPWTDCVDHVYWTTTN